MGPKMDSLLYAILGSLLRNRFVSPLWIRQTDTSGCGSPFRHACSLISNACFPASSLSFSLLLPPSPSFQRSGQDARCDKAVDYSLVVDVAMDGLHTRLDRDTFVVGEKVIVAASGQMMRRVAS
jgi:hypothetical protein